MELFSRAMELLSLGRFFCVLRREPQNERRKQWSFCFALAAWSSDSDPVVDLAIRWIELTGAVRGGATLLENSAI
jgi:hypothetical protein